MGNLAMSITTSGQIVEIAKVVVVSLTLLTLAYGAYKNHYSLSVEKDGVCVSLNPQTER